MVRLLSIVAAASLAAVTSADHHVTVKNTCSKTITPIFHAGTVTKTMAAIGKSGVTSFVVPEAVRASYVFST
jgi:hypothetical protein